ncbi:MAG TPA: GAF domain-containing protein, partial [Anaerolineae bacterium]|nr:GAF domain-containing protein [Anaerolineae bacterium]
AFTDEDVAVLQTLADQVALAIENARLLEEAQERVREIGLLLGRRGREGWRQMVAERPGWGYAYDGIEVMPRDAAKAAEEEPELRVPLEVRGEPIGHLDLVLPDRPPTPDEVVLARAVAEQASLALENARLFQETQRALREAEALYRASRAFGTATSLQEIVRGAAEVAAVLGFSACSLTLVTAADEERVPTQGDIHSVLIAEEEFIPIPSMADFTIVDRTAARIALRDPGFILIYPDAEDPQAAIPDEVRETMRNMGMRGMVTVGLEARGRPLGFLTFSSTDPVVDFLEERAHRVRTVADQVAIAVESRRLFEQTRRRAERERLRAEIASRVRASTEVDTILRTAIRELGRALRASDGLIRLGAGDGAASLQADGGVVDDENEFA